MMAAAGLLRDPALKAQVLGSLVFETKKQVGDILDWVPRVELLVGHRLLEEEAAGRAVTKLLVDGWVEGVLKLVSCKVPNSQWLGASLLGITCREVSAPRFLRSHTAWVASLLPLLAASEADLVRGGACSALSDWLQRVREVVEVPGVRRDAAALAAKIVPPLMQLLNTISQPPSSPLPPASLGLLHSLLSTFPLTLRHHVDAVESALLSHLLSNRPAWPTPSRLHHLSSCCFALLPDAAGQAGPSCTPSGHIIAAPWPVLANRVLLSIHTVLDALFVGLEDPATARAALASRVSPGEEPPRLLGVPAGTAGSTAGGTRLGVGVVAECADVDVQGACAEALIGVLRELVGTPTAVEVDVPVGPIMSLAARILSVDGSTTTPAVTDIPTSASATLLASTRYLRFCCLVPALHSSTLRLLRTTLNAVSSRALPYSADLCRLLDICLRRSTPLQGRVLGQAAIDCRVAAYQLGGCIVGCLGSGMSLLACPVLVPHAIADLQAVLHRLPGAVLSPYSNSADHIRAFRLDNTRKRKHPGVASGEDGDNLAADGDGAGVPGHLRRQLDTVVVVEAALRVLEVCLQVGGPLLPDNWRSDLDSTLASLAASLCFEQATPPSPPLLKLAVHRALLASVLSPHRHRPPYLPLALDLFRRGREETAGGLAQFCAQALLACESLLHPRRLPVLRPPVSSSALVNPADSMHAWEEAKTWCMVKGSGVTSTEAEGGSGVATAALKDIGVGLGRNRQADHERVAKEERGLVEGGCVEVEGSGTPLFSGGALDTQERVSTERFGPEAGSQRENEDAVKGHTPPAKGVVGGHAGVQSMAWTKGMEGQGMGEAVGSRVVSSPPECHVNELPVTEGEKSKRSVVGRVGPEFTMRVQHELDRRVAHDSRGRSMATAEGIGGESRGPIWSETGLREVRAAGAKLDSIRVPHEAVVHWHAEIVPIAKVEVAQPGPSEGAPGFPEDMQQLTSGEGLLVKGTRLTGVQDSANFRGTEEDESDASLPSIVDGDPDEDELQ